VACIGWFVGILVALQQDIAAIRATHAEDAQLTKQRDNATDRVAAIIETSRRSLALRNQRYAIYRINAFAPPALCLHCLLVVSECIADG
jgi:hypothetical protein